MDKYVIKTNRSTKKLLKTQTCFFYKHKKTGKLVRFCGPKRHELLQYKYKIGLGVGGVR